ncbi:MAG: hypothetical protein GAK30_02661 [Paracidovorax wautersii]|uniref:LamG-like jellyroll fold domain-containing protein n=1 Tax=Paracidovorax wautersii TaxID=1177982 RepID=A0A7V8FMI4_9BURK|nr:MAG: hypothetical protein GAK30_02661 [Paracidovorax wautersii]
MGTLTFTRESIANGTAPSGLVAYLIDGQVQLSWWGSAYATGYEVQRAAAATGPFTTLASVGEERTHTDTPSNGTWHYRVVAVTPGGRLTGTEVRSVATTPLLRLRLPLDEGSGSTANDASGNALHSQLLGGAAWGEGRLANTAAVALDGASGYVAMPTGIMQDLADFTISVWVYRLAGASGNARVFDIGTGDIVYLTVLFNGNNLTLGTTATTWHGKENVSSSTGLATGRWVHLAATRRGTTLTLYLDGQATGSNTDVQFAPHQMGATEQNWLGRAQYAADPYFKGRLQDFRLYSGALGATDIAALAAG